MINISVVGAQEVIARLRERQSKTMIAVQRTMTAQMTLLEAYIKREKLQSSPLHHRSGRLQGSIHNSVTNLGNVVVGKVYTNVEYAAIHEYGGQTKPHQIFPKNGKALAFMMGGNQVIVKSVNHPGSKMPERSFMRSSLAENREKIKLALQTAIGKVMREP